MTPILRPVPGVAASLRRSGLLLALAASSVSAQTVFVCLGGKAKLPSIISIPAPGHGWPHSAAAPVPGEQWNRVRRTAGVDATDPALAAGAQAVRLGIHELDTAVDIPLVDPAGNPTSARLGVRMEVLHLATDKPRAEPSIHSKSAGAVPEGLMDAAWRVYLPDNRLRFAISGLVPGRRYSLYCYGGAVDPVGNPSGDSEGARFILEKANIPAGSSGTAETVGGYYGSIYTFSPETDRIALSPEGATWIRLEAVADGQGIVEFFTTRNSRRRHFVNGFQLVESKG